jgi:hypothetical protein
MCELIHGGVIMLKRFSNVKPFVIVIVNTYHGCGKPVDIQWKCPCPVDLS